MGNKNKVTTYTPEQITNYRNFITNYDIKSDPIFDRNEISPELSDDQLGSYCINGACSIVQKGGLNFSNPQTKDGRYISNIDFSNAVKKDEEDWYKLSNYNITDYQSGDIVQYKNNKGRFPHHAGIIKKHADGTFSVIDNSGKTTWRDTYYSKETFDNLINSDELQIMRPGYSNDKEYLMKLKQEIKEKQKTNINVNSGDLIENYYVYRTGKDDDFANPKNKNQYTEVIINKLNNEDYLRKIAQTYNISNKDAQEIVKYTYGVIKQESDFRPKFSGKLGLEGGVEYLLSKFRNDKDLNKKYDFDPSTGYAQIKFNNLTADQKIKYDIRKPADLYDYAKSQAVLEDIIAKNYKYVLSHMDEIKKNHPSLTKENALKFALYMQNTPKMVMDPSYLDKAVDKVISDSYINSKKVQTSKNVSSNGVSRADIKKKLQLNLDKGSYPDKIIKYSNEIFQPSKLERPNKKQFGGRISEDPFDNNIRISKSGRKFTYPSVRQTKQEIINQIYS